MRPTPRIHAAIAALPLAIWIVFHLWEQWAVFEGRDAWIARMDTTSRGALATTIELALIVVPLIAWAALSLRALVRREPLPGSARAEDAGVARALGRLAPLAAIVSIAFLAVHVVHLWAPKLALGASAAEQWIAVTHDLGRPEVLVLYAVGLSASALHLAAALPAVLEALGVITTPGARRSALLVSATFALCAWILAAQLVGWVGTGAGTFWAIDVAPTP